MARATKQQEPDTPKMGRPPKPNAISKDPDWSKKSIFVRDKTVLDATYRLKSKKDPRTLSEVIDELLVGWLKTYPK